ncbi:MAG: putative phage holin [bacterium]
MKHPFTRRNSAVFLAIFTLIGILTALFVRDPRSGTYVFLGVTAAEAWTFTLFYGLASTWRVTAAARALFWIVFSYALLSTHLLVTVLFHFRPTWNQSVRQFLYLGLALAGMNSILTTLRLVLDSRSARLRATVGPDGLTVGTRE